VTRAAVYAAALGAFLALVAATFPTGHATAPEPGVVRVPCRPVVVGGRAECTGTADIPSGTRLVIYEPAPESSAAMVQRQILDARGGTP
jgi:hypothetical protein